MKRPLLILIFLGAFTFSCTKEVIIPKETMVDIYHDMYLLDQAIFKRDGHREIQDSVLIYEPIFNRYGYTFDDYTRSVNFYIQRPDKFEKVFAEVKHRYETRIREIDDSLSNEERKSVRWALIDSVRMLGPDSARTTLLYRCLDMIFFRPDTSFLTDYPLPDTSVMESWKLNVFELYQGDPFADTVPAGHLSFALPDTSSLKKDSGTETTREKSARREREINRKIKRNGSRLKKN